MVRICRFKRVGAVVALAVATSSATAESAASAGMSLQLHRLPGSSARYDTYQRRRLTGEGDTFESMPLNLGMGTHYAWVYAGTPPQRASVITDTGSSIMAFPCSECQGCGKHTDTPFLASNSSTLTHVTCSDQGYFRCQGCMGDGSEKKTCDISQSYMEGSSWHATVVEDVVYLGGVDSFQDVSMRDTYGTHFKFGCQTSATGLFITQVADGIMGLANNDNHIVAKLYKEQKIPNKLFSLCFAQDGGSMSIGAPDTSRHKGEISYAKLIKTMSHDFYGVNLRDVRVAGQSIEAPKSSLEFGQYIVDSGTTDSYLPSSMKPAFQAAFKKASGLDYHVSASSCQGYTDDQLVKLPNIEFILGAEDGGNLTLVITPDQYLLQEASGKYCSGIFLSESSGGVIGANIMMDHDVIFDQGNQRVGFVEANCDYAQAPPSSGVPPANMTTHESEPPTSVSPEPTAAAGQTSSPPAATTRAPIATVAETSTPQPSVATESPTDRPTSPPVKHDESPSVNLISVVPASTLPPPLSNASDKLTSTPPATTDAPTPEPTEPPATEAPASNVPQPTNAMGEVSAGVNMASETINDAEEEHPVVLTIVGTILAVAFIVVAVLSVRRHKKTKRDKKWRRVKETDGDEDGDDDEDDEEELMEHTPKRKKQKAAVSLDEFNVDDEDDDDDDGDHVRQHARIGGADSGEDDDDEIFDRDVDEHDGDKLDAKMLEQL